MIVGTLGACAAEAPVETVDSAVRPPDAGAGSEPEAACADMLCDDSDLCTTDTCVEPGACAFEPVPDACDDGDPCTSDACDPAIGCTHSFASGPCDDGDACTTGDSCVAGACDAGSAVVCDDSDPCTSDACDPASGCTHSFTPGPCDDGDACTTGDSCAAGACVAGSAVVCDDENPCTSDACDPALGCAHDPDDGASCSDGTPCTDGACVGGVCVGVPNDLCGGTVAPLCPPGACAEPCDEDLPLGFSGADCESATVGPEGGVVTAPDATLTVSPGTFESPGVLSIRAVGEAESHALPPDLVGAQAALLGAVRLGPAGQAFGAPVLVSLQLEAPGAPTGPLAVLRFDEGAQAWTRATLADGEALVAIVSADGSTASFVVDHFSIYGVSSADAFFAVKQCKGGVPTVVPSGLFTASAAADLLSEWMFCDPEKRRTYYSRYLFRLVTREALALSDHAQREEKTLTAFLETMEGPAGVSDFFVAVADELDTLVFAIGGADIEVARALPEVAGKLSTALGWFNAGLSAYQGVRDCFARAAFLNGIEIGQALDRLNALEATTQGSALWEGDSAFRDAFAGVRATLEQKLLAGSEEWGSAQMLELSAGECTEASFAGLGWELLKLAATKVLGKAGFWLWIADFVYTVAEKDWVLATKEALDLQAAASAHYLGEIGAAAPDIAEVPATLPYHDAGVRTTWIRAQIDAAADWRLLTTLADYLDASDTSAYNKAWKHLDGLFGLGYWGAKSLSKKYLEEAAKVEQLEAAIDEAWTTLCEAPGASETVYCNPPSFCDVTCAGRCGLVAGCACGMCDEGLACSSSSWCCAADSCGPVGYASSPWPMEGSDPGGTQRSPVAVSLKGRTLQWTFEAGRFHSPPVLAEDGTLYIGSEDKNLYSLTPEGDVKWAREQEVGIRGSALVGADGTVYVQGSALRAYFPNGDLRWEIPFDDADVTESEQSPVMSQDGILIAQRPPGSGHPPAVLAVHAFTGEVYWNKDLPWTGQGFSNGTITTPTMGVDGSIYVPTTTGELHALTREGETKWKVSMTGGEPLKGDMNRVRVLPQGLIVVTRWNLVDAYSAVDGSLAWTKTVGGVPLHGPAIDLSGNVIYGTNYDQNGNLASMSSVSGAINWFTEVQSNYLSLFYAPLVLADNTLLVARPGWPDSLLRLSSGGTVIEELPLPLTYTLYSPPIVGADGTIYVASADVSSSGILHALR